MGFEVDHVFVCTSVDGPEAAHLGTLGLVQDRSSVHPGQGTANRCFLFHNAYLELIWVHDEAEARSPLTTRTRIFDRWTNRTDGACPFGICLRPARGSGEGAPPFASWDYLPSYVPPSRPIRIGTNSETLGEPMLFFIGSGTRPDSRPESLVLTHPLGVRELTSLAWTRPAGARLSAEMQAVVDAACLDVRTGAAHEIELCFDDGARGENARLAPHLPITLRW